VSQEHLTHGLTVKLPPSLHADLVVASEREGVSCGRIIRRALRDELDGADTHRLDPYVALPSDEVQEHLHEAIRAIGSPEAVEALVFQVGDELADIIDAAIQAMDVLHDESAPQQLERVSGYLQQASRSLLLAASRTKAMRVNRAIEGGELERIEARLRSEGQPGERN
jgi:HEAT repeat protein